MNTLELRRIYPGLGKLFLNAILGTFPHPPPILHILTQRGGGGLKTDPEESHGQTEQRCSHKPRNANSSPKSREARHRFTLPKGLQRECGLPASSTCQPSGLQNCETMNFVGLSHPVCGDLLQVGAEKPGTIILPAAPLIFRSNTAC